MVPPWVAWEGSALAQKKRKCNSFVQMFKSVNGEGQPMSLSVRLGLSRLPLKSHGLRLNTRIRAKEFLA